MSAKPNILLFESANPRHAHEVDTFERLKDEIPEEKVLVPGVIDSTTNFIEHPELVAKRILSFSNIVGHQRFVLQEQLLTSYLPCSEFRQALTVALQLLASCLQCILTLPGLN